MSVTEKKNEPIELKTTIDEALKSGRFLITVSYRPDKEDDTLEHRSVTQNFLKDDILPSLKHIYSEIAKKEGLKTDQQSQSKSWD